MAFDLVFSRKMNLSNFVLGVGFCFISAILDDAALVTDSAEPEN